MILVPYMAAGVDDIRAQGRHVVSRMRVASIQEGEGERNFHHRATKGTENGHKGGHI